MHNNYLTLPVLFVMISNHYPLAYASRWNWLILALVLVIGAVIRHFYNIRHQGLPSPWWTWGVAAAGMLLVIWLSSFAPQTAPLAEEDTALLEAPVPFEEVENIVYARCSMCHAAEPLWDGMPVPPKGVMLETPEQIRLHRNDIALQAVRSHAMPPGNITEMEPYERAMVESWLQSGAPVGANQD
jgi:uncharacterized membrane protein